MKKLLTFMLALVMAFACLSTLIGCGKDRYADYDPDNFIADTSNPKIVKEPITITMFHPKAQIQPSWDEMRLWQEIEKITNIKIEFREADSSAYKDLRSLQWVNKDEWPDLFYGNNTLDEQMKYSKLGAITPLNDDDGEWGNLLEQYAPNFTAMMEKYPEIEKQATLDDGLMYSFTSINTVPRDLTYKMYVNKDWMEAEYGEGYEPQTVEEFKDMLIKFKDISTLNGQAIPLIGAGGGLGYVKNFILSAFGYTTSAIDVLPGTDEIVYVAATENYKAFLKYMNDLYNEGLLYQNSYSATTADVKAFGNKGLLGAFQGAGAFVIVGNDLDASYTSLSPITSSYSPVVDGVPQKLHLELNGFLPQFAMMTSTTPYKREIVRLIDWFYTEEAAMLATFGVENEHWEYTDDTKTNWRMILPEGTTNVETFRATLSPTAGLGAGAIGYRSYETVRYETDAANRKINQETQKYIPYLTSFPYGLKFTEEETDRKAIIETDINNHIKQYEMEFITGKRDIESGWQGHIDALKGYGLDELIDIYQAAYDRYMNI